jgi:hypothetical protein
MYAHCTLIWSVQPLLLLSLTFTSHPPFFNSFQYTSLYPLPSDVIFHYITDALSLSLPFPLSLSSRVVPLLQTCSTAEFVYDYACLYKYIYLLDLSSTYERTHVAFVFLSLAYFT